MDPFIRCYIWIDSSSWRRSCFWSFSILFTCKEKTYHLCDNLSWSEEIDGKLITTDYFSLPSPFIKYWNGDLCKIFDKYRRCECGRLFRNFEFVESRPFSLKGLLLHPLAFSQSLYLFGYPSYPATSF